MGSLYPDQETSSSSTSEAATPTGGLPIVSNIKFTPGGKGQIATMTSPTGVLMDENSSKSILANMQKLLEEKPFENFQNDLQKMYAWTKHDKEPMFRQLEEQRQQKEAQRYNIMQSMEALKSSQNQATALANSLGISTTGAQPAAGGQPTAGGKKPPYIEMLESLPSNLQDWGMTLLSSGQIGEFGKLVKENEFKKSELQKSLAFAETLPADQKDLVKRQLLKDAYGTQSYIKDGKTIQFTAPGAMPIQGTTPSTTTTTTGVNVAANVNNPTGIKQGNTYKPYDTPQAGVADTQDLAGKYLSGTGPMQGISPTPANIMGRWITGNPADGAKPEFKMHLDLLNSELKNADIKLNPDGTIPNTPQANAALSRAKIIGESGQQNAAKFLPYVDPNFKSGVKTAAAAPSAPVSQEDVQLKQKALQKSYETFMDVDYKDITERAKVAKDIEKMSDQVLANIESNNFGPGTKLGQSFMEYAQIAGVKLNPKELQKFVDNMGIETARKFMSASEARQAMGSQFTAQESSDWLRNFAGIDNHKDYIKNFYQVRRAGALVDQDLKNYLSRNKGREDEALVEWQNSGVKDKIMQENVDSFKNGKLGKVEVSGAKPSAKKTIQKTGMVTDKNNPNYGKKAILYNDGTLVYE